MERFTPVAPSIPLTVSRDVIVPFGRTGTVDVGSLVLRKARTVTIDATEQEIHISMLETLLLTLTASMSP